MIAQKVWALEVRLIIMPLLLRLKKLCKGLASRNIKSRFVPEVIGYATIAFYSPAKSQ
ncbi:hypothetical protein [Helicobacter mastomyrinus]|uniref:Uncharacterized protein n=1 Tax=Helicobacter mastomyrinus TaxID=287948 RepID=A0ABZ3F319_9HELI|nr:hypothetical protein [uncultured Helicobacter sp.]